MTTLFRVSKKIQLLSLSFIILSSCSNQNDSYIDAIKENVKRNASGVELNYQSIEFKWIDTLTVGERTNQIEGIKKGFNNDFLAIEAIVSDFDYGKLFSLEYLTKEKLIELREWERIKRKEFNPKQDYYQFAEDNKDKSEWLQKLLIQLKQTDSLITNYDQISEGNSTLIKNALNYYKRIDQYYGDENNSKLWSQVELRLDSIQKMDVEIQRLTALEDSDIIHLKAFNKYSIINPLLNNAKVEIQKYYFFDKKGLLIGSEEIQ
jgi:hypothetical protein